MMLNREKKIMETQRLILRSPQVEDVSAIFKICNSDNVLRYNAMEKVSTEELTRRFESESADHWTFHLVIKGSEEVIGAVFIEPDMLRYKVKAVSVAYYLDEKETQKGYMYEALNELLHYIFNVLEMDVVSARVFSANVASVGLLKKLGFQHEGTLRHAVCGYGDNIHEDLLFSLLKSEFNCIKKL